MFLARVFGAIAIAWPMTTAWSIDAPTEAERKRQELLEQLGLDTQPKSKPKNEPAEEPEEPREDEDEDEDEGAQAPDGPDEGAGPKKPGAPKETKTPQPRFTYAKAIHRMLERSCASCHKSGGSAGGTRFVLTGNVSRDYRTTRRFVNTKSPTSSTLVTKAAGKAHGGGAPFATGSTQHQRLVRWIRDGAPLGGARRSTPTPPAPTPTPPPTSRPPTPSKPPAGRKARRPRTPRRPAEPSARGAPTTGSVQWPQTEPRAPQKEAPVATGPVFVPQVHEILVENCKSCHTEGSFAAQGGLAVTGDAAADYEAARGMVDLDAPARSRLLTKAAGVEHGGGQVLAPKSDAHATILAWIEAGAPKTAPTPSDAAEMPEPAQAPTVDATTGASPPPESGARLGDGTPLGEDHGSRLPFALPFHLRLNGKLDFSYERRDYEDHPFKDGRNAFQTYHHFLFLSRSGAKDPFGFNVEMLTQAFWEFNARIAPKDKPFSFLFKAGKILVPFGREPLFHHSYGGRSGFDQEILPVIWAQPGVAANARVHLGPVSLANDLYTVQGYALDDADAVLDLQTDISPLDEVKPAFGDRIGVSWRPLTVWYSLLFNRLGHDRLLYTQAVDIEFWRLHDVPFVEDLVLALGGMRADVSGGGAGRDYYHFGSYATVGYFPIEHLYLQYRAGLRTTDNRRGLYFDDTRVDERDRGSHNLTIVGRYKGFYAWLQFFWNLEKANEQRDDFLRLTVGYEF